MSPLSAFPISICLLLVFHRLKKPIKEPWCLSYTRSFLMWTLFGIKKTYLLRLLLKITKFLIYFYRKSNGWRYMMSHAGFFVKAPFSAATHKLSQRNVWCISSVWWVMGACHFMDWESLKMYAVYFGPKKFAEIILLDTKIVN